MTIAIVAAGLVVGGASIALFIRQTLEFRAELRRIDALCAARREELHRAAESDRARMFALRQALLRHELREEAKVGERLPGLP